MSLYWDMQEIQITNQTGMALNYSTSTPLGHGEWDQSPAGQIPIGGTGVVAFRTRSVNAAEVGPGPGTVTYILPDMTTLEINFDMIFAVGQNTYAQASAGGVRGSSYSVTLTCSEVHWQGQGYRYTGVITIGPVSPDPAVRAKQTNTAICTITNPA